MKFLYLLLVLFLLTNHLNAQDDRFSILPTIGITRPILDNGLGFHIGVNPSIRLTKWLSGEVQISYVYTRINSSFLSGNEGIVNSVNTLIGGRFYLNSEDKKTRFFFNLLTGLNYNKEEENNISSEGKFQLGFSGGAFVDINRIIVGVSYDTPQNLSLKLGYSF